MTGELGIWQHATGLVPNEAFGYCVDDVARALLVDLAHARVLGWDAVSSSACRNTSRRICAHRSTRGSASKRTRFSRMTVAAHSVTLSCISQRRHQ